ncbi:hypothetical protein SAMN05216316_2832 [Nitrosovibrio sp. Nv6]|nr:hypothetical protein SAMN05216316_2832 [Nitrosovibrio sp. Nv6]
MVIVIEMCKMPGYINGRTSMRRRKADQLVVWKALKRESGFSYTLYGQNSGPWVNMFPMIAIDSVA